MGETMIVGSSTHIMGSTQCVGEKNEKKINTDKKFPPASVGTTVSVPIPDVDRGRG